jgi:uncharacterized protein YcgI (DUF1989 family)
LNGRLAFSFYQNTAVQRGISMKILQEATIPGREGGAWLVRRGQHIRVIDLEGGPVADFVCFNANNLNERFSQARTKANQGKFLITKGDNSHNSNWAAR